MKLLHPPRRDTRSNQAFTAVVNLARGTKTTRARRTRADNKENREEGLPLKQRADKIEEEGLPLKQRADKIEEEEYRRQHALTLAAGRRWRNWIWRRFESLERKRKGGERETKYVKKYINPFLFIWELLFVICWKDWFIYSYNYPINFSFLYVLMFKM